MHFTHTSSISIPMQTSSLSLIGPSFGVLLHNSLSFTLRTCFLQKRKLLLWEICLHIRRCCIDICIVCVSSSARASSTPHVLAWHCIRCSMLRIYIYPPFSRLDLFVHPSLCIIRSWPLDHACALQTPPSCPCTQRHTKLEVEGKLRRNLITSHVTLAIPEANTISPQLFLSNLPRILRGLNSLIWYYWY